MMKHTVAPPAPGPLPDAGRVGYEAYRAHTGGVSLASGEPLPTWEELKPEIWAAWDAAGGAMGNAIWQHQVGAIAAITDDLIVDPLRDRLVEIIAADKTHYDAGDPRRLDGRLPAAGTAWDTPKALALEALGVTEAEVLAILAHEAGGEPEP